MDDNSTSSEGKSKSPLGIIIGVIIALLLIGGLIYWFNNRNKLANQLSQTQDEVQNVNEESQQAREGVGDALQQGAQNVAGAIGDINNPVIRLAVAKAYAARLEAALDAQGKQDLNTIVVYVEKNPVVLVNRPSTLPAEINTAVTNLKSKLATAKQSIALSIQNAQDQVQAKINDLLTLTGTLAFVADDPVLGGSVFVMTETGTGKKYYFQFNAENSAAIKSNMLGKEVNIKIKVTGFEDGNVRYDVVSGPTLASPSPSAATQSGTTQ